MSGLMWSPWSTMSSAVLMTALRDAWPTTEARPRSIRAAPTPPAKALTLRAPALSPLMAGRSPPEPGVGPQLRLQLGPARVGLVAGGEHRGAEPPVGGHLGVVPGHSQLVGGVVVTVDHVGDGQVGEGGKAVGHPRGDEHPQGVVC